MGEAPLYMFHGNQTPFTGTKGLFGMVLQTLILMAF
jgi:hypothetical protein